MKVTVSSKDGGMVQVDAESDEIVAIVKAVGGELAAVATQQLGGALFADAATGAGIASPRRRVMERDDDATA